MNDDLLKALAAGATLLTATQRLSRHLRAQFDRHESGAGLTVWPSADILPFPTWLHRCWEEALEYPEDSVASGSPPGPANGEAGGESPDAAEATEAAAAGGADAAGGE